MMTTELMGYLAAGICFLAAIPFVYGILTKKVYVERVTWFVWTIITVVIAVTFDKEGDPANYIFAQGLVVSTAIVWLCTLYYGRPGLTPRNILCVVMSMLAIIFWLMYKSSTIGICMSLVAHFIAFLPTLDHARQKPREEPRLGWTLGTVGASINFAAFFLGDMALSKGLYSGYTFTIQWMAMYYLYRQHPGEAQT